MVVFVQKLVRFWVKARLLGAWSLRHLLFYVVCTHYSEIEPLRQLVLRCRASIGLKQSWNSGLKQSISSLSVWSHTKSQWLLLQCLRSCMQWPLLSVPGICHDCLATARRRACIESSILVWYGGIHIVIGVLTGSKLVCIVADGAFIGCAAVVIQCRLVLWGKFHLDLMFCLIYFSESV